MVEGTPKTRTDERGLSLPAVAVGILDRQRRLQAGFRARAAERRIDNDLVFTGQRGQPLQEASAANIMQRLCERLGLPRVTPLGLRHLHASVLLDAGLPVPVVAARLGHATPSVTMGIYARLMRRQDGEAAETIGRALADNQHLSLSGSG